MTVNATAWARQLGCCALAFVIWLRPAPAASAPAGAACAAAQQGTADKNPWPAPLDRKVTLHLRDVPLRDALDRLSAAARVRFSYTDELLPLDRSVCISLKDVPVGDALARVLEGVRVTPVAAGADQVILAPMRVAAALDSIPAPAHVVPLDRIVVTGSASGGRQRELPVALSVVSRKALDAGSTGTMSQIMDATVPGVWMWEQSPASVASSYGSIRGASSFGLTSPKVYLDGIQIANPLLLSQIAPGAVERIEVIRGPQGAALYGADALSGVVNIVTRREHLEPGTPRRHLQSAMGMTESSFAANGTLSQDHAFGLRGGSDVRSGGLDIDLGTAGPFLPGAFNRHATLNGNGRVVGTRTILTGTARFFAEDAGVAHNPLLGLALPTPTPADSQLERYHRAYGTRTDSTPGPQALREYTIGGTATFMQDLHWTHSMTLGLDGYTLQGVPQDHGPIPSAASDSAFAAARGSADRGTLRLSSVGRFGDPDRAGATLTFAAEQSILRENTAALTGGPLTSPAMVAADQTVLQWQQTSAAIAQAEGALHNSLFLTAGLRAEQDAGLAAGAQRALLPVVGAALAREAGPFTIKFRAAYGRGIRPPQTAVRETMWTGIHAQLTSPNLAPERQSGVEAGVDILLGDVASLQLTRYSQTASGLIQWVGIPATTSSAYGGHAGMFADSAGRHELQGTRIDYELENLGAIANRGWEMQASANLAPIWLTGTLSYTDSRVQSTAGGYLGDLRPGDRVLGVPAWTGSVMASWNLHGWASTLSAYRAYDWINYDRLGLAQASLSGRTHEAIGWNLRNYWKRYDGNTHLRASASRDLGRGLTFLVTGDNLLNKQLGEPDNTTVLPGRTISLGIRAAF